MSTYNPYFIQDNQIYQQNFKGIVGNNFHASPMNVQPQYHSYAGNINSAYRTYSVQQMYMPKPTPQHHNYGTHSSYHAVPNIELVLRAQVEDFINMGLEKQLTEVSATKESTKILKNWLKQHRNNPYPSKTEKVMLAYSTRMTLTQISNWFANARRRIKQQKSCDKFSDSILEVSFENKQITSNMTVMTVNTTETCVKTPETECEIGNHSLQVSLNEPQITPDSGIESFIEFDDSFQRTQDENNQKGLKCKTNLFGTDPVQDINVEPLETTGKLPNVLKAKETSNKKSKIWSIADILDAK